MTDDAQTFYTRWARLYDLVATHTPGVSALRRRVVAALAPAPGDTVVELGCGTGANLPYLRAAVGDAGTVVGVDFAPGAVRRARRRIRRAGWTNVHVVRGDATAPPVADADAVLASFLVGMLGDPEAAVEQWASLLPDGGRLALADLARTTRPLARALNVAFRGLVVASAPRGTWARHGESPTRVLDRRVAAAHRTLHRLCRATNYGTHALGFFRVSAGGV